MRWTSDKWIALCLSLVLLLAPIGSAVGAVQAALADEAPLAMQMDDRSASPCADCAEHGAKVNAHACCEGTSCALIGGCAACAATFDRLRLPTPIVSLLGSFSDTVPAAVSHDPDVSLRPPRA